jgi:hypothetical protein
MGSISDIITPTTATSTTPKVIVSCRVTTTRTKIIDQIIWWCVYPEYKTVSMYINQTLHDATNIVGGEVKDFCMVEDEEHT